MYNSPHVHRFIDFAEQNALPYAIVSDKYGLHFPDQDLANYDVGPWDLSLAARRDLGCTIGHQARSRGHREILFHNTSPLMSHPYLEILSHSGLRVYFLTRLPNTLS